MKNEHEKKILKITEMLVNPENPRFHPVDNQREAIEEMIEDQQMKLVSLAESIIENGLSPMDLILVEPENDQWLVLEGNRRITVLKLLNEPSLIPAKYSPIKKRFKQMQKSLNEDVLENVECVTCSNRDEANKWISLKHTGENNGAGTVSWNAQQSSRFASQTGNKTDPFLNFLDTLRGSDLVPQKYKENFSKIKKTNFDRLMGDPEVRALLGVSKEKNKCTIPNGVNAYLLKVLEELSADNLNVKKIYYKEDRKHYIKELKEKVAQESGHESNIFPQKDDLATEESDIFDSEFWSEELEGSVEDDKKGQAQNAVDVSVGQPKSYPTERTRLVPSDCNLIIEQHRIRKIFLELKSLEIKKCPNAVAVLFRVFIELSCDEFIEKKSLTEVRENSRLREKIEAIASHFYKEKIMSKNALRTARQMASGDKENVSVKTFHSYVHNRNVTPAAQDLKSAWDDLFEFTENLWKE